MEQQDGWVLATFPQRLAAFIVDALLTNVPTLIGVLSLVFAMIMGTDNDTVFAVFLVIALASLVALLCYFVWWLFALRRGQTPGKQVVGIRAIRDDGSPSDWGYTFVREFVIKFLVGGVLSGMTGGIYWVVDHLWPLFDDNSQALHDKMVGTLVVQDQRSNRLNS